MLWVFFFLCGGHLNEEVSHIAFSVPFVSKDLHGCFCKFRKHNINLQSFFGPEEHHKNDLTLLHYNTCLQKDGILSISVIKCHGRAVLLIILLNNGTHLKPFHSISQHSLVSLMSYLSARFCFFYQKIALNAYSDIK